MAKRKPKESDFELLLNAPWWLSAILSVAGYVLFQWIIPAMMSSNPATKLVALGFKPFGTVIGLVCGLIAVVLYFKQRSIRSLRLVPSAEISKQDLVPDTKSPVSNSDAVAHALGDAMKKTVTDVPLQKPTEWSSDLLHQIEWKRVEELTAAYFREKTFRTETIQAGADGGIDVKLFTKDKTEPFAIVQCKAWNTQKVGVKPVRELLGVMAHEKVAKGIFVTTGEYSQDAIAFAKENPINLITVEMLLKGIFALTDDAKNRLLAVATEGDYTTPSCPSCGIKMVRRSSDRGVFWGCSNYPRCKQKFFTKTDAV